MALVLVTGGSGRLGRVLLPRLIADGHQVRALVRRPETPLPAGVEAVSGDLARGVLAADALAGVAHVVHLASGAAEGEISAVDVEGTRLLIERARAGGAPHLLYLSIVGIERVEYPLYQAKVDIESMLASSGLPWTVLRTTQFHELIRDWLAAGPPRTFSAGTLYQPVACAEVAEAVVARLAAGPARGVVEMGGPEVLDARDLARTFADVTGRPPAALAERPAGLASPPDALVAPEHREGRITWRAFLEAERAAGRV